MPMFTQNQNSLIYVFPMQKIGENPARRRLFFILAVVLPSLSACGGGGSSSAAAPPNNSTTNPISGGGILDGGVAGILFQNVQGDGDPWLSLVESDNGFIPAQGNAGDINKALSKYPTPQPIKGISTTFSKISYISSQLSQLQDPGRFILWGIQAGKPTFNQINYQLHGQWSCVLCNANGLLGSGSLDGNISVDIQNKNAELQLSGDGLTMEFDLQLDRDLAFFSKNLPNLISLDGTALRAICSNLHGALFGPNAEEAGALFGIADDTGKVFAGAVVGKQSLSP